MNLKTTKGKINVRTDELCAGSTCFRKGDFDMWTDEAEWDSKSPVVPYRLLPPYDHDDPERERVSKYPPPKELLKADGN